MGTTRHKTVDKQKEDGMKKLFLAMLLVSAFMLQAYAAVGVLDDGSAVGQATNINIKGTVADTFDGNTYSIDVTRPAVLGVGTGTATKATATTNDVFVTGKLEVDGGLYVDNAIYTDDTIYGTGQGISFKAVATCGCKTYVDGLCVEKGTCS